MLPDSVQAAFAIASILQVTLAALASTMYVHLLATEHPKLTRVHKHLRIAEGERLADPHLRILDRRPSHPQPGRACGPPSRNSTCHAMYAWPIAMSKTRGRETRMECPLRHYPSRTTV